MTRFFYTLLCMFFGITGYALSQPTEWSIVKVPTDVKEYIEYKEIVCIDDYTCFALGWISNYRSIIERSIDGGQTWTTLYLAPDPPSTKLYALSVPDPDHLYLGSDNGILQKSNDAGKTWQQVSLGGQREVKLIAMHDSLQGVAYRYHTLSITHDGWKTFTSVDILSTLHTDYIAEALQMLDAHTILLSTSTAFFRSDNGGETWTTSELPSPCQSMKFIDYNNGWCAGSKATGAGHRQRDIILHTSDGGKIWQVQVDTEIEPAFGLIDIDFADSLNGIAVGRTTKILRTSDGGKHWSQYPYPYPITDTIMAGLTFLNTVSYPVPTLALVGSNVPGYILRYSSGTTTVTEGSSATHNILVFPNPAQSFVHIQFPQSESMILQKGSADIIITDVLGRQVVSTTITTEEPVIPIAMLPYGLYFLRVSIGDAVATTTFLVAR